jgi:hypothetical protein
MYRGYRATSRPNHRVPLVTALTLKLRFNLGTLSKVDLDGTHVKQAAHLQCIAGPGGTRPDFLVLLVLLKTWHLLLPYIGYQG